MSRIPSLVALTLFAACLWRPAWCAPTDSQGPVNSNLDGELFYEVLVGELTAQNNDHAAAFALMLDAARKANSSSLYERAVGIALHARSGNSALEAAQAWARAFPGSREANRYQLQILVGLNRIAETQEPLKRELAALTPVARVEAINQLPRFFARATDKKLVAQVLEKTLVTETVNRVTGPAAWAAIGTLRLQADDTVGALDAARRGLALNGDSEEPVYLAIELIGPKTTSAEAIARKYLAGKPSAELRMAYARKLISAQRYADAYEQAQILTTQEPTFADAWLLRGSIELQDAKLALAEASLKAFVERNPAPAQATDTPTMGRSLVQAYLLLAQVAEQNLNFVEAKNYLSHITSPTDALRVQRRLASILAREGKLDEARAAIRNVAELQASDALDKVNAEAQLLRDSRQYAQAFALLQEAAARYPEDTDLLYDQAMMAEKLGKNDELERLLRKVIQARPTDHQAYNALGYSLADRNIRLDEARQLVVKALEFAPDDPFITDSLAWVEYRSGNPQEALRLLKGAFQARPDAELAAHLGEVLWSVGEREQAIAIWKQGIELNPKNETLIETMQRLRGNP